MSSWRIGLLVFGIFLIVIGWYMKNQEKTVIVQKEQVETIQGTKKRNAVIGGAVGGAAGAVAGVTIGGIGIAACGTGIGVPVGIVCLGLASIVGGTGALVGYSTGKATEQKTIMVDVPMEVPAYDTWLWIVLLLIGTVCIITVIYFELKKRFQPL